MERNEFVMSIPQTKQNLTQEQLDLLQFPSLPNYLKEELLTIDLSKKFERNYQAQVYKRMLKKLQDQTIAENVS